MNRAEPQKAAKKKAKKGDLYSRHATTSLLRDSLLLPIMHLILIHIPATEHGNQYSTIRISATEFEFRNLRPNIWNSFQLILLFLLLLLFLLIPTIYFMTRGKRGQTRRTSRNPKFEIYDNGGILEIKFNLWNEHFLYVI